MLMNNCTFCNSSASVFRYSTKDLWDNKYDIRQCNECRAYFLSPFPTNEMLGIAYDESYYGCSEKKFSGPIEKVLDYFRKHRAKRISKLLPENGNIIDIGCGNGNFLMSLLDFGKYNLFGSELEGKSAQRAALHKDLHLSTEPINTGSFEKESFDVVTMFHVFEHLTKPRLMLDSVKSFLKNDGYFVVSFPNIGSLQSRIFKGKWLHLDPPRHLFFFETEDFIKIMNDYGFELISKKYFSLEQNPYGFVQSFLNLFLKKREVLFELLKGNKKYTSEYSSLNLFFQKLIFVFLYPFAIVGDAFSSMFGKGATVEYVFRKVKGK